MPSTGAEFRAGLRPEDTPIFKKVLAVGGSDPSGGAGVQADLKTLNELGVYPYTAVAAITAQNSGSFFLSEIIPASLLRAQIDAILEDGPINGIKTGMLGSSENIIEVASIIAEQQVKYSIIDPVIKATAGKELLADASIAVYKKRLLPHGFMVTPNIDEASKLTGIKIDDRAGMLEAAKKLKETGVAWVLVKGGHLDGDGAIDLLFDGTSDYVFESRRIKKANVRGTGCMLASAICAYLTQGCSAPEAVSRAKAYVYEKIKTAILIGKGSLQATHFIATNTICREDDVSEDRLDK